MATESTHPQTPPSDALNGWKEIGAYLSKSVRSVQRWERQYGLPVHRINTPNGQIVYASRQEIDAWRVRMDSQPGASVLQPHTESADGRDETEDPSVSGAEPTTGVRLSSESRGAMRYGRPAGALVLLALAGTWLTTLLFGGGRHELPTEFVLKGSHLEARERAGRLLWFHPFDSEVSPSGSSYIRRWPEKSDTVAHTDIDGDGNLDVLLAVRFGKEGQVAPKSDGLFAISDEGRVLLTVANLPRWSCGTESFDGPWRITDVLVSEGAGPKRIWVAYAHDWSWPSFVLEVGAGGTQRLRYFQTGWLMSLAVWATPLGTRIAAGGVLNGPDRPSVAVFDPDGPATTSPYDKPAYWCADAPAARPERVLLFPTLDVTPAGGWPYTMVHRMSAVGSDLKVELDSGNLLAIVGPDGSVKTLTATDSYWSYHRKLEALHALTHSAESCPERSRAHETRNWTIAGGWHTSLIEPPGR